MKANYHTHTVRCHHAQGADEEYVKEAIAKGLTTLGFSDHTPYVFPDGIVNPDKMLPEELPGYIESLLGLKEKYRSQIDIKIGLEAEYYGGLFDSLLELYRKYPIEYIILGQHWVGTYGEPNTLSSFTSTKDGSSLKTFVDQSIEAIRTRRFTYIAHPDVLNFRGDEQIYLNEMRRLVDEAVKLGLPLEINLQGLRRNRWYPRESFWKMAAKMGATAIIGCDAHTPEDIAAPADIAKATEFVKKLGLNVIEHPKLVNPLF